MVTRLPGRRLTAKEAEKELEKIKKELADELKRMEN